MISPSRQSVSPGELLDKFTPVTSKEQDGTPPSLVKDFCEFESVSFLSKIESTPSRSSVGQVPTPMLKQRAGTTSMSKSTWSVEDFEVGRTIGRGNFGVVRRARERRTGFICALKSISKRRVLRLKVRDHVQREIEIQGHLHHPNVLRLFGAFWDNSCIHLCLELATEGNLYQHMRRQPAKRFDNALAAGFMIQLVSAISHCHRAHVMHRDIKPENALVAYGMKLKLCDFGWAAHTDPKDKRWTLCGTLDYLPPEMVRSEDGHSFEVDSWSLGVLAFELMTGQPPFLARSRSETYRRILAADVVFPDDFTEEACDFVSQMVQQRASDRANLEEARVHPWLQTIQRHQMIGSPGTTSEQLPNPP